MSEPTNPQGQATIDLLWPRPTVAQIVLLGEHDLSTCPEVAVAVESAFDSANHIILDLSKTEFIDSSIVRELIRARRQADNDSKNFHLLLGTAAPVVERVLELTGVTRYLNRVTTLNQALADTRTDNGQRKPHSQEAKAQAKR